MSRRQFLRDVGRGGAGLAAVSLLAACGAETPAPAPSGQPGELPPLANEVRIAQWPLYIDRARGGHRPTLEAFEEETGIHPDYREVINDNQAFFAKLIPQFEAGQDTQWDLITLSDWVVTQMNGQGWIEEFDHSLLPNVRENMLPAFRDPVYDPGNAHSIPWQGGVTGVAYNPELTHRKLTSFADLWDPAFEGHVGMLTEMVDVMSLTLLMLGVEPLEATVDDARRAQEELIKQRDAGIVRNYYGNDYINELVNGDTWATMAWSGDVFYHKYLGDGPQLEFIVPEEGGMLWATPVEIPVLAQHPRDAHAFIDFYYRPEIAVQVTDWVLYMTPVKGVQELMLQKAEELKGADRAYYETLAASPLLFPPKDISEANLHEYKALSPEEFEVYAGLFSDLINA